MSLEFSRIRALIFDVDGTLRDTDDQMVLTLEKWLWPGRFIFPGRQSRSVARWLVMKTETPGNFIFSLPDRFGIDVLTDTTERSPTFTLPPFRCTEMLNSDLYLGPKTYAFGPVPGIKEEIPVVGTENKAI